MNNKHNCRISTTDKDCSTCKHQLLYGAERKSKTLKRQYTYCLQDAYTGINKDNLIVCDLYEKCLLTNKG